MAKKKPARKAKRKAKVGAKAMLAMGRYAASVSAKNKKPTKRQAAAGKNIVSSRRGPVSGPKFGNRRTLTRASGITVAARG